MLQAFGVPPTLVQLAGGEGRSWHSGDLVLKPVDDGEEAGWVAQVLAQLPEVGFRVPRPVRAGDGSWVVDGWTASRWVAGRHDLSGRWPEVLEVADRFHGALSDLPRPGFLDRRTHPWSVGDRVAWGEASRPTQSRALDPLLQRLYGYLHPVGLPSQVIHGDLPGNVLFAEGLPPAVIDFSPYYRPAGFATAIVIVDAIAWYGASPDLAEHAGDVELLDQLVARAAIYRLVTADVVSASQTTDWVLRQAEAHRPILELIGA
ncbi:MAG TPA: hypothetical protein VFA11_00390 [Acidimicrobiales bacterium]|nr:hypothetical protein [Acidimicrobiales bacterium]